uniref:Uncharacterized protein n=1 Tax=Rhizophora mucronata TaxID=61149 RepID=A0A2P2PJT1_RHIMU
MKPCYWYLGHSLQLVRAISNYFYW